MLDTLELIPLLQPVFGTPSRYMQKVLGYSPIAYWPLNEISGSEAVCQVDSAQNGDYSGVTLADAKGPGGVGRAPFFDGVNDWVDVISNSLRSAYDGAENTIMFWGKVYNSGVWTDNMVRCGPCFWDDSSNVQYFLKENEDNNLKGRSAAGGTGKDRVVETSTLAWFHFAMTTSETADEVRVFFNGLQEGATLTGLGSFDGELTHASIGCIDYGSQQSHWHGWLAHCAAWDSVLAAAIIEDLARV